MDNFDPEDFNTGGGNSGNTSADTSIKAYDGQTADDAANDKVGSNKDLFWELNDFTTDIVVTYNDTQATVETANSDVKYITSGAHVVLDLKTGDVSGANVVVKGTSGDGSLKIYGSNKFKLTLSGVDLTSSKGPAINDQCGKRVFLHLTEGTTNRLTDCAEYGTDIYSASTDEDRKGCFFSEGNVIVSGSGTLVIAGKYKHGLCSDGAIYVRPGATIAVTEAAKNAIHANGDSDDNMGITVTGGLIYASCTATAGKCIKCDMDVLVSGGTLDLYTSGGAEYDTDEKDTSSASCIKSDKNITITGGTLTCKSVGTAGKGLKADGNITIGEEGTDGPTLTVATTGGTYSYNGTKAMGGPGGGGMMPGGGGNSSSGITSKAKAIKAEGIIKINSGELTISTAQDGAEGIESKTKSTGSVVFNGGRTFVQAYDDAVNSAGQISFQGGYVFAYSTGNDAVDSNYGSTNSIVVNGGALVAHGVKSPEEGIDADNARYLTFTKGTVFSSGGIQSNSGSPSCSMPVIQLSNYSLSKGYFTVTDSTGKVMMSVYVPRSMSACYSYVAADFASNTTYSYGVLSSLSDSYSPATKWDSYMYWGGTLSGLSGSFTTSTGYSTAK